MIHFHFPSPFGNGYKMVLGVSVVFDRWQGRGILLSCGLGLVLLLSKSFGATGCLRECAPLK